MDFDDQPPYATLPTPLAELYVRVEKTDERHAPVLEAYAGQLAEATIQFVASVLLAYYLRSDLSSKAVESAIQSLKGNMTLGKWISCLREASAQVRRAPFPDSVRELARIYAEEPARPEMSRFATVVRDLRPADDTDFADAENVASVAAFIDLVASYRNCKAHGAACWIAQHADQLAGPFTRAVRSLVLTFTPLRRYPVFRASSITPSGPLFHHMGDLFVGEQPRKIFIAMDYQLSDAVLVYDPEDASVSLSPFYEVLDCPKPCFGDRVFGICGDVGKENPVYFHAECGNSRFHEAAAAVWRDTFDSERRRRGRGRVLHRVATDPPKRTVKTGETFAVVVEIENASAHSIRCLEVDLPLPLSVELVGGPPPPVACLAPRGSAVLTFRLRTYDTPKVTFRGGTLRYVLADGRPVSRPLDEASVLVAFDTFPALVGRAAELDILRGRWLHAAGGTGHLVAIFGPQGVGKSVLARTFLDEVVLARTPRAIVLAATCADEDPNPYASFLSLLKEYVVRHADPDTVERVLAKRLQMTASQFAAEEVAQPVLMAVVAEVLGLSGVAPMHAPDQDLFGEDSLGTNCRSGFFATVASAFARIAAGQPVLILLDNLHLVKSDGWQLFRYLNRQLARLPFLVIATVEDPRPSTAILASGPPSTGELRCYFQESKATIVGLAPLSSADIAALLDLLLPENRLPDATKKAMTEFSQRNPAWLVETICALRDGGHILRRDGCWVLAGGQTGPAIGEAFSRLIHQRHSSLDPMLQRVVNNATVLGKKFAREILADVLAQGDWRPHAIELNSLLRDLRDIHQILRDTDYEIEFAHERIQEIIYARMDPGLRQSLHRYVAEVLERKNNPARWCGDLAYHWICAGQAERAVEHLVTTAGRHEEVVAYDEAIRLVERALGIARDRPGLRPPDWEFKTSRRLSKLRLLNGDIDAAVQLDLRNIDLGKTVEAYAEVCDIYRILSMTFAAQGDFPRAVEMANAGHDLAVARRLDEPEYKLHLQQGLLARDQRHFAEAEKLLTECRQYAARGKRTWLEASAQRHLGVLYRMMGRFPQAEKCFGAAAKLFSGLTERSRLYGLAMTYHAEGSLLLQQGKLDRARDRLEKSTKLRKQLGDIVGTSRSLFNEAKLALLCGRAAQALQLVDASQELKRRISDHEGLAKGHELRGDVFAEEDRWKEALEEYDAAVRTYERLDMQWNALRVKVGSLLVQMAVGNMAAAQALVHEIEAADTSEWDVPARITHRLAKAEYARRAGDLEGASRQLAAIERDFGAKMDALQRRQVDFARAVIVLDCGRPKEAVTLLRAGLEREGVKDQPFNAARYGNLLGKALRKAGDHMGAEQALMDCLRTIDGIEDPLGRALTLDELGKVEIDRGDRARARKWFEEAIRVKERLSDTYGLEVSRKLLAMCDEGPAPASPISMPVRVAKAGRPPSGAAATRATGGKHRAATDRAKPVSARPDRTTSRGRPR